MYQANEEDEYEEDVEDEEEEAGPVQSAEAAPADARDTPPPAPPPSAPPPSHSPPSAPGHAAADTGNSGGGPGLAAIAAGAATVALGALLIWRAARRRGSRRRPREPDYGALVSAVAVPGAPQAGAAAGKPGPSQPAALPLAGTTVILSGLCAAQLLRACVEPTQGKRCPVLKAKAVIIDMRARRLASWRFLHGV